MIPKVLVRARELANKFRASNSVQRIHAAKKNDVGELYIYAAIGSSWWSDGVTAKDVIEKLDSLKGSKTLHVRISSEGGDVWEAKAIENAIRRFEAADKVTYVDGLAASAATFIAMACPKVVSAANATWMIHEASGVAMGRASDMRACADMIDMENMTIAETYARKTGLSAQECLSLMAAETWMNAQEAKDKGFTDEIETPDEEPDEDDTKAAASVDPIVALAAQTQDRLDAFRTARMQMRATQIRDDRASAGVKREGQPERAAQ